MDEAIETTVLDYALEQPAHGQVRVSNELRKRGTFVSPSGVRSIWLRHGLANFIQRIRATLGPQDTFYVGTLKTSVFELTP